MNNQIQVHATVSQAAGTVLDHMMNDPLIQQQLRDWIQHMYPNLNQAEACSEIMENTVQENLYYAASVEFHSRVLAVASIGLLHEP